MGQVLTIAVPAICLVGLTALVHARRRPVRPVIPPVHRRRVRYTRIRAPTPPPIEIQPSRHICASPTLDPIIPDDETYRINLPIKSLPSPVPTLSESPVPSPVPTPSESPVPSPVSTPSESLVPSPVPSRASDSDFGIESVASVSDLEWDTTSDWTVVAGMQNPLTKYLPDFAGKYHIGIVGAQATGKTTLSNVMKATIEYVASHPKNVGIDADTIRQIYRDALTGSETTMVENDRRDPTPWVLQNNMVLWDIAGGGVRGMPSADYVDRNGIAFMSCVLVLVGLYDTDVTDAVVDQLRDQGIPFVLVQTHTDDYMRKLHKAAHDLALVTEQAPAPIDVDTELRKRRDYLRKTYRLTDRDTVMCINGTPWVEKPTTDFEAFGADVYDLIDCILYALNAAKAAHTN